MSTKKKDQELWKAEEQRRERKARLERQRSRSGGKKPIRQKIKLANLVLILILILVIGGLVLNSLMNNGYRERHVAALEIDGEKVPANVLNFYASLSSQLFAEDFPRGIFVPEARERLSQKMPAGGAEDSADSQNLREIILLSAKQQLSTDLMTLKEAEKAGFQASEEGQKAAESVLGQLTTAAAQSGNPLRVVIETQYGPGNNRETVKELISNFYKAEEYREQLKSSFAPSVEELEKTYANNPEKYDQASFRVVQFLPIEDEYHDFSKGEVLSEAADENEAAATEEEDSSTAEDESAAEEETAGESPAGEEAADAEAEHSPEELLENAKARAAEMLSKVSSEEDFVKLQAKYAAKQQRERLEENPEASIQRSRKANLAPEIADFLFAEGRKAGDMEVLESNGVAWLVYFLERGRNEERSYDARHIFFAVKEDASAEEEAEVKALAERVLAEYQAGEESEESFAQLVSQYSQDQGSIAKGGLYDKVQPGSFVPEFEEFVLSPGRKAGDVGLVKSSLGYHIIYFVGLNEEIWQSTIKSEVENEALTEWLKNLTENVEVKEAKGMRYVLPLR